MEPVIEAPKPGFRTTEYWLSLGSIIVGALLASGIVETGSVWDKLLGLAATLFGALGYTVSRTVVKSAQYKAIAFTKRDP